MVEAAKNYCTACWLGKPIRYLRIFSPWDDLTKTGNATCLDSCGDGYTSNGDNIGYKCVRCNEMCSTCDDNGRNRDKDRCVKCAATHPFFYARDQLCLRACENGYFNIEARKDPKGLAAPVPSCDKCQPPCAHCVGTKNNCTKCDPMSVTKALFTQRVGTGASAALLGRCMAACPGSYFAENTGASSPPEAGDFKCNLCESPCAACEGKKDFCTRCNGQDNKYYVDRSTGLCHVDCPDGKAADLEAQICYGCAANCAKCTGPGPRACIRCSRPWLLEEGACVKECNATKGYWASRDGTTCIDTTEFPLIGPIFTIITIIVTIAVVLIKMLMYKETEVLPTLIAWVSIVEWVAIIFAIPVAFAFEQERIGYICVFTIIALYVCNGINFWYV